MGVSMGKPEIPDWIPDWKDDASYPAKFEDWRPAKWVWEFLRRNAYYRADYERFAALPAFYPHGGKTSKWCGQSGGGDMAFRYCNPPALPGENSDEYWKRLAGNVIDEMPLEAHLVNKYIR